MDHFINLCQSYALTLRLQLNLSLNIRKQSALSGMYYHSIFTKRMYWVLMNTLFCNHWWNNSHLHSQTASCGYKVLWQGVHERKVSPSLTARSLSWSCGTIGDRFVYTFFGELSWWTRSQIMIKLYHRNCMINETDRRCVTGGGIQRCVESSKVYGISFTWPSKRLHYII